MNKREFVTKHLKFKCFVTVGFTFVYSLSTESLAYNLTEDASRFLLHFICVVGIEVLRDRCVFVPKTGSYVNGLCSCLNELSGMRVPETVCVEVMCSQHLPE